MAKLNAPLSIIVVMIRILIRRISCYLQLIITVVFGCIVGAIYFNQKNGQDGLQNRYWAKLFNIWLCCQLLLSFFVYSIARLFAFVCVSVCLSICFVCFVLSVCSLFIYFNLFVLVSVCLFVFCLSFVCVCVIFFFVCVGEETNDWHFYCISVTPRYLNISGKSVCSLPLRIINVIMLWGKISSLIKSHMF